MTTNHLSGQTSPYLLQHAANPVDWYPWSPEALTKARQENKPILLSIGYAACHWCHVMARESFEDERVALLMNQWFVCIKVDREERPDLDKIYQTAHQLLTGQPGGWPLTIFLSPDKQTPFYSGTYFPPEPSFGRPSFKDVLIEVAHFYHQRRDVIEKMSNTIIEALNKISQYSQTHEDLNQEPLLLAREDLEKSFDFTHGGFGHAPKFPLPTHLDFLLAFYYFQKCVDAEALKMVKHALYSMARGGCYDQLGGGFFRYCLDANWRIPHFEKMLYDNAQLIPLYVCVGLMSADLFLQNIAVSTIHWALREMRAPGGGFYSSINAESEGEEGKYYVWDRQQVRDLLTHVEYTAIEAYFGLNQPPNFEGRWHIYLAPTDDSGLSEYIRRASEKLLSIREQRIHPTIDNKILTSWNALMLKALSIAALRLDRQDFIEIAETNLNFILNHIWKNNRLLAVYSQGPNELPGYLDDYAFLLDAVLNFLQAKWQDHYLQFAIDLADQMLEYFLDQENGGFFFTAKDQEQLLQRPKIFADEATPSGNGIAALGLLQLGNLLGEKKYFQAAENVLKAAWDSIKSRPSAHDSLLKALNAYLNSPGIIILRGDENHLDGWRKEFFKHYLLDYLCFAIPSHSNNLPLALQKPVPETGVSAYICQDQVCSLSTESLEKFMDFLTSQSCISK